MKTRGERKWLTSTAAVTLPMLAVLLAVARAAKYPGCRAQGEWQCDDSTCIPSSRRCDGARDCPYDLSDEENCERSPVACSASQWQCDGSRCLPSSKRCDGLFDCADMADESGCDDICLPGNFKCKDGSCIPEEKRCDKHKDCSDDEINCVGCQKNEFQCADKTCIPERYHCNGYTECRDHSDEIYCGKNNKNKTDIVGDIKLQEYPPETASQLPETASQIPETEHNVSNILVPSVYTVILFLIHQCFR